MLHMKPSKYEGTLVISKKARSSCILSVKSGASPQTDGNARKIAAKHDLLSNHMSLHKRMLSAVDN